MTDSIYKGDKLIEVVYDSFVDGYLEIEECQICGSPIGSLPSYQTLGKVRKIYHWACLPASRALRHNDDKPQTSYILHFPKVLELLARIMTVGEVKYSKFNWKKGGNTDQSYMDAALRHMLKFTAGDVFDEEYGTHHLGHAIWNLMALVELNDHEIMDVDKYYTALKELKDKYDNA